MTVQSGALVTTGRLLTGRKVLLLFAAAILAGGFAAWHYLAGQKDNGEFVTQKVTYGDITQTVSASGTIEPVQQVTLTFKSQGYVQNSYVQVGDRVKKGQVLAEEQDSDFQAQLAQAESNLQSAEANYNKLVSTRPQKIAQAQAQLDQNESNLNLAKTTLDRDQSLFAAGALTQADLDTAKNNYQSALSQYQSSMNNLSLVSNTDDIAAAAAQVKAAQAQVALAQNNLAGARIIAPFDGYVAQINGNVGQWTQGGAPPAGTAVSSQYGIILSSTDLQLSAEVNEADISKVKIGQQATFTVDTYPNRTFSGKITSLAPMATSVNNVQMYEAIISIDDYSGLKAGMPATVNIITASARHVPVIPQAALDYARSYFAAPRQNTRRSTQQGRTGQNTQWNARQGGTSANLRDRSFVVVLEDGKTVLKPVQTGLSDDVNVEIKSGLQPGEIIITGQTGSAGSSGSEGAANASGNNGNRAGGGRVPGLGPGIGGVGRAIGGR